MPAKMMDICVFPAIDTEFDGLLASPDFLEFLSEHDLAGPLPVIPEANPVLAYGSPELASSCVTAAPFAPSQQAVPQQKAELQQQIPIVTSSCPPPPVALSPGECTGTMVNPGYTGTLALQQQQPQPLVQLHKQMQVQPQHQMVLPLQPSRTTSTVSSDASAGRAFAPSAPGSPVSSQPAPSCSDITSLPVHSVRFSSGTSASRPAVDGPAAKRAKLQSCTAVTTAPGEPHPENQQKPLTKQQIAANKRRAPEVDWCSIDDPSERRRQRRLAKNRITAARSRERKKEQMADMEERMSSLEQENAQLRTLLTSLTQENTGLKEQLASLTRGAAVFNTGSSPEPAVRKCLAIMHLVACLTLAVKTSFGLVLTLVLSLVQQGLLPGGSAASVLCICRSMTASCVTDVGGADACLKWLNGAAATRPRLRGACMVCCAGGVCSVQHMAACAA